MALISIVYRLSNRRVVSSRVSVLRNQTNAIHPASSSSPCSRQLHSLTSLAMAAPSTGTRLRLVAHNTDVNRLSELQSRTLAKGRPLGSRRRLLIVLVWKDIPREKIRAKTDPESDPRRTVWKQVVLCCRGGQKETRNMRGSAPCLDGAIFYPRRNVDSPQVVLGRASEAYKNNRGRGGVDGSIFLEHPGFRNDSRCNISSTEAGVITDHGPTHPEGVLSGRGDFLEISASAPKYHGFETRFRGRSSGKRAWYTLNPKRPPGSLERGRRLKYRPHHLTGRDG
ncbi:hypothetical protein AVEN_113901-1 [Araneus ventricosus]|uniref:Uncharacterized protein n=1 Tax=Araneus ventricosus TaxID=182803 RepID=A0A4Y2M527_ARAVE|nr:hypothetical protein AVEN_113901-1 [Araneus ventricosus]